MASTRTPRTTSATSPSEVADPVVEAARDADVPGVDAPIRGRGERSVDSARALPASLQAPSPQAPSPQLPSLQSAALHSAALAPAALQSASLARGREAAQAVTSAARAGRSVLLYAGLSGTARLRNDDRWQVAADIGLLLVADGVSGYPAGDMAAELAVQTACQLVPDLLQHGLTPAEALARAMTVCNDEIREFAASRPDCTGMATTLVCALIHDGQLHLAHAGDSRAYLLRGGRLSRLTRDHCVGQQIVETGRLTEAQVSELPARGILTRALGLADRIDPEQASTSWQADDTLLLCSDGLTEALSDPIVEHLLQAAAPRGPAGQVRALIGGALQTGIAVNATALVATAAERLSPGLDQDRPH